MKKRSDTAFDIGICVFIFLFGYHISHHLLWSLAAPLVIAALLIGSALLEKYADSRNDEDSDSSEELLEYKLSHGFSDFKGDTLAEDYKKRLRSPMVYAFLVMSVMFLALGVFAFRYSAGGLLCGILVSIMMLAMALRGLLALPLKAFTDACGEEYERISSDYMNGSLITHGEHGICIGAEISKNE